MSDLFLTTVLTLDASVRVCVPLIFASMAGLFAERSGVVDIGLEGKLLMSAFIAASAASVFGSPWLGLIAGMFASSVLAMIHGFASITYKGAFEAFIELIPLSLTVFITPGWPVPVTIVPGEFPRRTS